MFSKWIFDAVLEGMNAYEQVAQYEAILQVHEKELTDILQHTNCNNTEAVVNEVLSILREGTANSIIHAIMKSEEKLIVDFANDAAWDAIGDLLTKVFPKANIYMMVADFFTDIAMLACDATNTKLRVWDVEALYSDYLTVKQDLKNAIDAFYVDRTLATFNQLYYTAKYYALVVRSSSNQVSIILESDAESFTGLIQSFFDKVSVEERVEYAKDVPIEDDQRLIFFMDKLFPTAQPI